VDFGGVTDAEYERLADEFLGAPLLRCGLVQGAKCLNGDHLRYDPTGGGFGVLAQNGHIRTFFKPRPSVHGKGSNADYFCGCVK
jgi:pyocin large subunit-like protein